MDDLETRIRGFLKAIHSHGIAYRRNATSFPTKLNDPDLTHNWSHLPTRHTGPQVWTLGGPCALDVRGNVTTLRDLPSQNVHTFTWFHHGLVSNGELTKAGESVLAELARFDLVSHWNGGESEWIDILCFQSRSDLLPLQRLDPDWSALDETFLPLGLRSKVLETVATTPDECVTCLIAPALRVAFLHSLILVSMSCGGYVSWLDVEGPIIKCLTAFGYTLFEDQREVLFRTGLLLLEVVKSLYEKGLTELTTEAIAEVCVELTLGERKMLEVVFYDGDACSRHKRCGVSGEAVFCGTHDHPLDHHRPDRGYGAGSGVGCAYEASINKLWQLGEGYSVMSALSEPSQLAWA